MAGLATLLGWRLQELVELPVRGMMQPGCEVFLGRKQIRRRYWALARSGRAALSARSLSLPWPSTGSGISGRRHERGRIVDFEMAFPPPGVTGQHVSTIRSTTDEKSNDRQARGIHRGNR